MGDTGMNDMNSSNNINNIKMDSSNDSKYTEVTDENEDNMNSESKKEEEEDDEDDEEETEIDFESYPDEEYEKLIQYNAPADNDAKDELITALFAKGRALEFCFLNPKNGKFLERYKVSQACSVIS